MSSERDLLNCYYIETYNYDILKKEFKNDENIEELAKLVGSTNINLEAFINNMFLPAIDDSLLHKFLLKLVDSTTNKIKKEIFYSYIAKVLPGYMIPSEDIVIASQINKSFQIHFQTVNITNGRLDQNFPILLRMLNAGSAQRFDSKISICYVDKPTLRHMDVANMYILNESDKHLVELLYHKKLLHNIVFKNNNLNEVSDLPWENIKLDNGLIVAEHYIKYEDVKVEFKTIFLPLVIVLLASLGNVFVIIACFVALACYRLF